MSSRWIIGMALAALVFGFVALGFGLPDSSTYIMASWVLMAQAAIREAQEG